jgi:hypothetical protein
MLTAQEAAMTLMWGQMRELAVHMCSSIVEPALLYGCEVWGQNCLQLTDPAGNNSLEVEQVHRNFIRCGLNGAKEHLHLGCI